MNESVHPTRGMSIRVIDVVLAGAAAMVLASSFASGQAQQSKPMRQKATATTSQGQAMRGKYLVEGVAMCGMCHTPRNDSGEVDRERPLSGAALWLLPAAPVDRDWPLKAPRIAGSPAAGDADVVRLLTTGIWKDGSRLRPPMPQFRMSPEDAAAVVAYLRSLTPAAGD